MMDVSVALHISQVMYYLCPVRLSTSLEGPEDIYPVVGIWAPLGGMLAIEGCLNPLTSRAARQVLVGTSLSGTGGTAVWAQGLLQGRVSELGPAKAWGGPMRSSCWVRLAPHPLWDTL